MKINRTRGVDRLCVRGIIKHMKTTLTDSLQTNYFESTTNDVSLALGASGFVAVKHDGSTVTFHKYAKAAQGGGLWLIARVLISIDRAYVRNETTGENIAPMTVADLLEVFA